MMERVVGEGRRGLRVLLAGNKPPNDSALHFRMILNGNIFQTAPSSEFRTGSSLEKYVLSKLTNSELNLVWNSELGISLEFVFFHMIEYIAKKNIV